MERPSVVVRAVAWPEREARVSSAMREGVVARGGVGTSQRVDMAVQGDGAACRFRGVWGGNLWHSTLGSPPCPSWGMGL